MVSAHKQVGPRNGLASAIYFIAGHGGYWLHPMARMGHNAQTAPPSKRSSSPPVECPPAGGFQFASSMTPTAQSAGSYRRTYQTLFPHLVSHRPGWHDLPAPFPELDKVEERPNCRLTRLRIGDEIFGNRNDAHADDTPVGINRIPRGGLDQLPRPSSPTRQAGSGAPWATG